MEPRSVDVASLLKLVLPSGASAPSPAAALALACHVVMVDAGFIVHDREATLSTLHPFKRRSPYQPNAGWQQESGHEWQFTYVRRGKALPITLTVSLHGPSGRVLAHAVQGDFDAPAHACVVGLQLDRYINTDEMTKGRGSAHVLSNGPALVALMADHIMNPIISFPDTDISTAKLSDRVQQLMLGSSPSLVAAGGVAVIAVLAAAATIAFRARRAA